MRLPTLVPRSWNATAEEIAATYPCDSFQPAGFAAYTRAIDIEADVSTVFRCLCQLKVASYAYDWLSFPRTPSPSTLTPGADQLALGQQFLVFELVDFEPDGHLTGRVTEKGRRTYGDLSVSYTVKPGADRSTTRLVARLDAPPAGALSWLPREALSAGDLLMTRRQLKNLKRLAEQQPDRDSYGGAAG
jgi:hypothetical protein